MLLFHWLTFSYLFYSMARTKVTPKKDERGRERWVLCSREVRRALAEKGWRPPPQFITHPRPGSPCPHERRRRGRWRRQRSGWRKQESWRMWEDPHHCCQPNSWPRWLWRLGHLLQVRTSQSGGSSDLLWEAKLPRRNSSRLERSRRPGSTGLAQLVFERSGNSKRALSSSLGNSPSHG